MTSASPEQRKQHNQTYYKNGGKERVLASKARILERNRAIIAEAKSVPCHDCGMQYPTYVMDFDHVRGEKSGNISQLGRHCSVATLKAEIAKCEVVCANCHRERTHG